MYISTIFSLALNGVLLFIVIAGIALIAYRLYGGEKMIKSLFNNSEEFYDLKNSVFDNSLNAFIVTDLDGNIKLWNATAEKKFGYKSIEVFNKQLSDLIIPDKYKAMHVSGMRMYKETGESHLVNNPDGMALEAQTKDKTSLHIRLFLKRLEVNNKIYIGGYIVDKTNEKNLINSLNAKIDLLNLGEKINNTGTWVWDMVTDIVTYSDSFANIFDVEPGEKFTAADLMEVVYITDRKRVNEALLKALEEGLDYVIDYRISSHRNGRIDSVNCIGKAVRNENNKTIGVKGTITVTQIDVRNVV